MGGIFRAGGLLLNIKIILALLAAVCARAQTTCPPINFLNAKTVNLDATDSSHLVVLRQSGGSYTAFEVANTSPYGVLRAIPNFQKQFSNCLGRATSVTEGRAAIVSATSQRAAQRSLVSSKGRCYCGRARSCVHRSCTGTVGLCD